MLIPLIMIMIALVDRNQTYCHGLQTMLEQVEDFRVVIMTPDNFCMEIEKDPSVSILLVDNDLYLACQERKTRKEDPAGSLKTIVLTMDRDELDYSPNGQEVMYKGSGKKEFEERIRRLVEKDLHVRS